LCQNSHLLDEQKELQVKGLSCSLINRLIVKLKLVSWIGESIENTEFKYLPVGDKIFIKIFLTLYETIQNHAPEKFWRMWENDHIILNEGRNLQKKIY
jgi:hypothetical protein